MIIHTTITNNKNPPPYMYKSYYDMLLVVLLSDAGFVDGVDDLFCMFIVIESVPTYYIHYYSILLFADMYPPATY